MNIGQEIVVLRAEKGWTQQQFAEQLKTSQRTVAAWESGDSVPRKTMMVKIAQLFGLPPDYFLDSGVGGANGSRNGIAPVISDSASNKVVMEDIGNIISNTYHDMDDEKKTQIIEAIQGVLDAVDEK